MSSSTEGLVWSHDPIDDGGGIHPVARAVDALTARLAYLFKTRPTATRFVLASLIVVSLVLALIRRAHAQQLLQDPIEISFDLAYTRDIFDNSVALAQYIFATLATLTVMVRGLAYYIKYQSVKGLGQVVLSSVLSLGLPFLIISIVPTIIPSVSMVGLQIADIVTGNPGSQIGNVTPANGVIPPDQVKNELTNLYHDVFPGNLSNANDVSPTTIVNTGITLAWPLVTRAYEISKQSATAPTSQNSVSFTSNQNFVNIVLWLGIATIGAFIFIAVELVIAYIQIYLVLPVAAFTLGFLGSPATRSFGTGYWTVTIQALVRFTTILFVIGLALTLANTYQTYFANIANSPLPTSGTDVGVLKTMITSAGLAFALLYIVRVVPSMFMSVISGASVGAEGSTNAFEYQVGNNLQRFPSTPRQVGGRTVATSPLSSK